jgi:phage terminase small subunit
VLDWSVANGVDHSKAGLAVQRMPVPITDRKMTPRQQRFVDEFLVDLNATQAAIRAGYSARTANEQGARLLANASIAAAVQLAQQARSDRLQITQDDVLRGLRREATLNGEGATHAARVSAWGLLGKHLGMFVERRQQLGENGEAVNPAKLFTVSITG